LSVAQPTYVYSLNGNIKPDVTRLSPQTKIIYRRQSDGWQRLPDNFFNDDPVASATKWLTVKPKGEATNLLGNWALNPADYFDPLNEVSIELPANPTPAQIADMVYKAQYLNTWMITALNIAAQNGFKLALFSFPFGSPAYEVWQYLLPAMRRGKELGAILSLHSYTDSGGMLQYNSDGTFTPTTMNTTLRHRIVYSQYVPVDAQLPIVLTEASSGNGYAVQYSGQAWINDMGAYDTELFKDAYVLGICGFQLGGAESNLVKVLTPYAQYIHDHPTVVPPMNQESLNDTIIPPAPVIYDAGLHAWTLGTQVVHGYALLKDGVQFGGGQGVLLLYHNRSVYTKNDLGEWYMATETSWSAVSGDPRKSAPQGVDVSKWQGAIDWTLVRKVAKKDFAFIKATQGSNIIDARFVENWKKAKLAGIPRGAYHYFMFTASETAQFNLLMSALNGDYGELPITVDVEDTSINPSNASVYMQRLHNFITMIEQRTGRAPQIYTAKWFWNTTRFPSQAWAKNYPLWVASYTTAPLLPDDWTMCKFWQYANDGQVDGITGNVDLNVFNGTQEQLDQYATGVIVVPPPVNSTAWRGIHGRADGYDHNATGFGLEKQVFQVSKCTALKIMTNSTYESLDAFIAQGLDPKKMVLRLFADFAGRVVTPQDFYSWQTGWLNKFASVGGIYVEIHNESNLPSEGYGTSWANGQQFAVWYTQVVNLIKANFISLKMVYPGLSPQVNVPEFEATLPSLIASGKVDLIGAHSYWINASDMNSTSGGRYYRRFFQYGKPILLTEFANVNAADSDTVKGQQYKAYYASLESQVLGAYAFVSSASDPTFNTTKQTWIRNNSITDIAYQVGA